jgi:S1-C subfamily serine protease
MTQQQGNHYATLGVTPTASEREIKRAYRERCRECHPDLNPGSEATARMQEVNAAYSVLSSPTRRAEYDRWQQAQAAGLAGTEAPVGAAPEPAEFCCEKCRASDASLRITMFTWVISLLIVSYKRGWAKILCGRCRVKYSLLFNLEVLLFGWWGIPYGPIWSAQALWYNAQGGKQTREHNAALLFAVGYRFFVKGNYLEAEKALAASLKEKHDPKVEALLKETRSMSMMMASAEPSWFENLWKLRLHPAAYNLPLVMLMVALWVACFEPKDNTKSDAAGLVPKQGAVIGTWKQRFGAWLGSESNHWALGKLWHDRMQQSAQDSSDYAFARARAKEHLRVAASGGNADAQILLVGVLTETSEATERSDVFRKVAKQGLATTQFEVGCLLGMDSVEGWTLVHLAAEQGYMAAMQNLAWYYSGELCRLNLSASWEEQSIHRDHMEATKWYQKMWDVCQSRSVDLDGRTIEPITRASAAHALGKAYLLARGVPKDVGKAYEFFNFAAREYPYLEFNATEIILGGMARNSWPGHPADYVEAYMWFNQAAAYKKYAGGILYKYDELVLMAAFAESPSQERSATQPRDPSIDRERLAARMTSEQVAEAVRRGRVLTARNSGNPSVASPNATGGHPLQKGPEPNRSGTGFFITAEGHVCTSYHVVKNASRLAIQTSNEVLPAQLVRADPANDLAVLKVEGKFNAVPLGSSPVPRLGQSVLTIGFPNMSVQGTAPKLTRGEINSLTGLRDDPRNFQISVAIQPGNSGGPLLDFGGNVVGVVRGSLSEASALQSSGSLPQSVNYAVKSAYLLALVEAVPELSSKLKKPRRTTDRKAEDVASEAQDAVFIVLAY